MGIWFGLSLFNTPNAAATIRQLEEAPGQQVYQTRQTLYDQHGNPWQAIAPYIGQYNLQPLLPQLQAEIPLKLSLPTSNGEHRQLLVSPAFMQEWQTLAQLG